MDVIYYIPKTLILSEFIWQLDDRPPDYPRVQKFLRYWKEDIEAVIHEVLLTNAETSEVQSVDWYRSI